MVLNYESYKLEAKKENEKYFNRVYKSRADRAEMTSKLLLSISILIRHCDLSQWRHPE